MFGRAIWEINYPGAFLKFLKLPEYNVDNFKIVKKITRVIYPQICPNQTSDYWLITPNQLTLCIESNIF